MTGLSVLYAKQALNEQEWARIPCRDRTGRLREVYWARRAEGKFGRRSFLEMNLYWRLDRSKMGRRPDHPGDGFIYVIRMLPGLEDQFEWWEVTEVFTTVPAAQVEGAMKAWNGIYNKQPVNFDGFRRGLRRTRPSRAEQRRAADRVIEAVKRKLSKASYNELLEKYGHGTLVVGMPLWFAVLPEDPFRAENALDDFSTRVGLGLEQIDQEELRRSDCPFKNIIVTWDTTPEALRDWRKRRSTEYEDVANTWLDDLVPAPPLEVLSESLSSALSKTGIPESEAPSVGLHIRVKTRKKRSGTGPYPELVVLLGEWVQEQEAIVRGIGQKLRLWTTLTLCNLLCFVRIHGLDGLERWVSRRLSVSRATKVSAIRWKARRFYSESQMRRRF